MIFDISSKKAWSSKFYINQNSIFYQIRAKFVSFSSCYVEYRYEDLQCQSILSLKGTLTAGFFDIVTKLKWNSYSNENKR